MSDTDFGSFLGSRRANSGELPELRLVGKPLALLVFLALEPRAHRRESLTALLWGESPEEKANASFRQALRRLRAMLGDHLHIDRKFVELRGAVKCDVLDFLELARRDPAAAANIDIPSFLAGLSFQQGAAFNEWADAKRAELLGRYDEVLAKGWREAMSRRDWELAARVAERWTAMAPLDEGAVSALVESRFQRGDRSAALAAYRLYASRLQAETGRRPGPSLEVLFARISRAGTARSADGADTHRAPGPSFVASLIGRAHEWQALSHSWNTTVNGDSAIAVVEGDPGVGKTRLVDDFFRCVTLGGGVLLRGQGYDAARNAPYGTIADLIRSSMDAPGLAGIDPPRLAEMASLVPELRLRFPGLPSTSVGGRPEEWRVLEAVAQGMMAIAEEGRLAILIDDLHWCDAESCGVLHALIRRLDQAPVLWCATLTPGAAERDAAPAKLARALRASRRATSISLDPLSAVHVRALIRELARTTEPAGARRLATRIHDVTGGNPFYIIELLKTLFHRGVLAVDERTGGWIVRASALGDAEPLVLAPLLHAAIVERIACLPEIAGAVLITIAVSRRGCRPDVLSHVHGISRLRAAALGDRLVERHLATERNGVYGCAHPVIARVVRNGLTASRRNEVHRALALSMALVLPPDADARDLDDAAHHAEQAGEYSLAQRFTLHASEAGRLRGVQTEDLAPEEALAPLDWPRLSREDLDLPSRP